MLYLEKKKLEKVLKARGLNMSQLSKLCGVSRQSIYNMFGKTSVFNTVFEKILVHLAVDHNKITVGQSREGLIIKTFPDKIAKTAAKLSAFAGQTHADLLLFGSRAKGKRGFRTDWDFAVRFHKSNEDKKLKLLKQQCIEESFPFRIDIINLNLAPAWFKDSISDDCIYLRKEGDK